MMESGLREMEALVKPHLQAAGALVQRARKLLVQDHLHQARNNNISNQSSQLAARS